jgi:DNA replication and repair protein RecF
VLIASRQRAVASLATLAAEMHGRLSGAGEALEVAYEPQLGEEWRRLLKPEASAGEVASLFAAALASQRRREAAAGLSLVGPHRDDLTVRLNGVAAASFGSRAQIRTATLALRLAEARLLKQRSADPPVVLLDDIVSEMDARRRSSVFASLDGFDQVWLTATSAETLPPDFLTGAHAYSIAAGEVAPA